MRNVLMIFAVIIVASLFANPPSEPIADAAGTDAPATPLLLAARPSDAECRDGTCSIARRYESVKQSPASYSSVSREVVRSGNYCDRPLMNAGRAVLRKIRHPFNGRFSRR